MIRCVLFGLLLTGCVTKPGGKLGVDMPLLPYQPPEEPEADEPDDDDLDAPDDDAGDGGESGGTIDADAP